MLTNLSSSNTKVVAKSFKSNGGTSLKLENLVKESSEPKTTKLDESIKKPKTETKKTKNKS